MIIKILNYILQLHFILHSILQFFYPYEKTIQYLYGIFLKD